MVGLVLGWLSKASSLVLDYISQLLWKIILAWTVTFTAISTLIMCLGFGPIGIGIGTLAASFQSFMYGGFTPAGGIFATLTSMAMRGCLMPAVAILAALPATVVALIIWACGVVGNLGSTEALAGWEETGIATSQL
ncbi:hypothetical protein G6O67_004165 [Ophiocordyceps sinensis]|uniref:Uncharacterized protein n=1 Tax=Ophiocordyceps sinensis TaxID=72228 RepID=A0A8H4LY36_9HYPO|nr:hypothetical protein G6O67_004165 [Ophiocordyceps sinensis]